MIATTSHVRVTVSPTLSRYIGRQFFVWFAGVFLGLAALLFMFDTVELVRRAASRPEATITVILQMAFLRLPHLSQVTIAFAMLFGSMLAFWRLSRHHELVVARAAGVSVWQFLLPALGVATVVATVNVLAFSPIAAVGYSTFERMESTYFDRRPDTLAVSGGLWLRDESGEDDIIIHAKRVAVSPEDRRLEDVLILVFEGEDRFRTRIDAPAAELMQGAWLVSDALVTSTDAQPERIDSLNLPTRLDWERIEKSFASPTTMPLWKIPEFIETLEAAGFSAVEHRAYFHSALASPLALCAMVLIAAAFTLKPNRRGGMLGLIVGGVTAGLTYYIVSEVFLRFGLAGQIPSALAAWAPPAIGCLLGAASLLHLEDG